MLRLFCDRKRYYRRNLGLLGAILATLVLTGCEQRFGMPRPATEQAKGVLTLWYITLYTAAALGALVFGLLFYSLIRHRHRDDSLPKQNSGNTKLELTYTVIPFIIVGLLFAYGVVVQTQGTHLSKNPDVTVNVTAFQWNWRFDYPNKGITIIGNNQDLPELVLPENKRARLNLESADVAHSFFVPGFLTKRDVIPGVRNQIEITPDRAGEYVGHCAEFCGVGHSQMNFKVRVLKQSEFDAWTKQQQTDQARTTTTTIGNRQSQSGLQTTTSTAPTTGSVAERRQ